MSTIKNYHPRKIEAELLRLSQLYPIVAITGPRQSGKTTLCKHQFPNYHYINLENPSSRELLLNNPEGFLQQYQTGLIIDEAHHLPELFSYLQITVDENPSSKFVLTGSSNFSLMESITQSLAGRAAILILLPLSLQEIENKTEGDTDTLLLNGGYPAVWFKDIPAFDAARNYYNTYIERDVRSLLNIKDISKFQIFMKLCAGRIGSELNASALSGEVGVSVPTIQEWFSVLEASYIIFRLPPFFRNIGKRLVKSPKLYFCDTALACYLLGIENEDHLATHPLRGSVFENLVILEFLKERFNRGKDSNLYFYRDQSQNEVDLLEENGKKISAYEIKSAKFFNRSFVNNLDYLRKNIGEDLVSTKVIYDGTEQLDSPDNGIINFRQLKW